MNCENYKYRIAYGIGQNYYRLSKKIADLNINYVMDQKWENDKDICEVDGIPIIRMKDLEKLENILIIIIPDSVGICRQIDMLFADMPNVTIKHIYDFISATNVIFGNDLRLSLPDEKWEDGNGNIVYFDKTISEKLKIIFYGSNNVIYIGHNVSIGKTEIICGNNSRIKIGDYTTIVDCSIHASEANVDIGADCMLSSNIVIRNHDDHHIFELNSFRRVNYSKNVDIGNHVWLCRGVILHSGCKIGDGSVVGENAITSGRFPENVVIAGVPAKVIRKEICWSRDNTFFFNRDVLSDCVDQNAKKYIYKKNRVYIVGAHSRGTTLGYYLKYLEPSIEILAYLYDDEEENPSNINGVPVIKIDENYKLDTSISVYIATRAENHTHLISTLKKCGMQLIIPVDVKFDLEIRNKFLKKYYESIDRKYLKIDAFEVTVDSSVKDNISARVYVAESVYDKPLQKLYELADYEKLIQVGTALTDKRLDTDCFDNIGENISDRNKQFCELTGLYWIWKHAAEDIVGLCHYRRHFIIPKDWKERMDIHKIDVILPLPLYVSPSIEGNFKSRHVAENWDNMLDYLKEKRPLDYESALRFFRETALYSPCNMFIMRREVLDELCSWMFPILMYVTEKGGIADDIYQNRYPGFISERLITYFFDKNRDKYKIVYADKNFLA